MRHTVVDLSRAGLPPDFDKFAPDTRVRMRVPVMGLCGLTSWHSAGLEGRIASRYFRDGDTIVFVELDGFPGSRVGPIADPEWHSTLEILTGE